MENSSYIELYSRNGGQTADFMADVLDGVYRGNLMQEVIIPFCFYFVWNFEFSAVVEGIFFLR